MNKEKRELLNKFKINPLELKKKIEKLEESLEIEAFKFDTEKKVVKKIKELKQKEKEASKIYEITDVKYAYPKLSFTTKVSSGTYIRSLAEDIGQKLGTGAYLSALRRLQVGRYNVSNAVSVKQATAAVVKRA